MSLATIFILACLWILFRDRKDWFNYVIVALAALFLGGTRVGSNIGPWMVQRAADIDSGVKSIFSSITYQHIIALWLS